MRNNDPGMAHLVRLFGSHAAVAKAAGADAGAVHRWPPVRGIAPVYQRRLLAAARDYGMSLHEVMWAVGVKTCPCCGEVTDDTIRNQLQRWEKGID